MEDTGPIKEKLTEAVIAERRTCWADKSGSIKLTDL